MRHLLDTRTLDRETALRILDVAEDMSDTQSREVKKLPTLRGKTVVNPVSYTHLTLPTSDLV